MIEIACIKNMKEQTNKEIHKIKLINKKCDVILRSMFTKITSILSQKS